MNRLREGHVARLPDPGVRIVNGKELYSSAWLSDSTEGVNMDTEKPVVETGISIRVTGALDDVLGPELVGLAVPPGTYVIGRGEDGTTILEARTFCPDCGSPIDEKKDLT